MCVILTHFSNVNGSSVSSSVLARTERRASFDMMQQLQRGVDKASRGDEPCFKCFPTFLGLDIMLQSIRSQYFELRIFIGKIRFKPR